MAAGDALAVRLGPATAAGRINFQPAAGTEYAITFYAAQAGGTGTTRLDIYDGTNAVGITDLVNSAAGVVMAKVGTTLYAAAINKIFITNSIYLSLNAQQAGDVCFITGVQTK